MLDSYVLGIAVLLASALLLWLISIPMRNVAIVDIFWGLGFVAIAWITWLGTGSPVDPSRGLLTAVLVTIWGCRLAGYLAWRSLGKPEDHRYAAMREHTGERFWLHSLFYVFWLQAVILAFVSLPVVHAISFNAPLQWFDGLGVALWLLGFAFETIGDFQLAKFKADPANRGKVLDRGLWKYTRHPNYFGDFLVWWGFFLLAIGGGGWWTFVGPLLMSILLMRVSGAALLERSLKPRVAGYADYVRRTSSFFPRPPRTASSCTSK